MTSIAQWRGVFAIPPTPFHDDLQIDFDSLRKTVRFGLDCGVRGLVASAIASETAYFSDREHRQVIETTLTECNGAVPIVVGISSQSVLQAIDIARFAKEMGADAIMAMPPVNAGESELRAHYARLAEASPLPIVIQNWMGAGGTPMPARVLVELVRDYPACAIIKEETEAAGQMISQIIALSGGKARVMGAKSGLHLIEEHRRGACGTMVAIEFPEFQVRIWDLLDAGKMEEAEALYQKLLPLLLFEVGHGVHMWKGVLHRRGIIRSVAARQTGHRRFDQAGLAYLDHLLRRLAPLMDARYPLLT